MSEELDEIAVEGGRFVVATETSCYVLDFDERTLVRVPDAGRGSVDDAGVAVAALRGDHLPLRLVDAGHVRLGERLVFVLDVRGDGVLTRRVSTFVRRIVRLDL
jgi:hypothetical protein